MPLPNIHDLIYFDLEKASSIWSQFQWGRTESMSVTQDSSSDQKASGALGIPNTAQVALEKGQGEKYSILENKILHHDLLNRVDALLSNADLVVDLNAAIRNDETSPAVVRATIGEKPYIKAQGWSVIEDYQRIMTIAGKFGELIEFITQVQQEAVRKTPVFLQLQEMISSKRKEIGQIKDRNTRAVEKSKLEEMEKTIDQQLKSKMIDFDPKLIDAMKLFVTTFMPNRINFRIYPLPNCPSFQVLCNLKRECFVDQDLEHLLYGYGNRPNVQLAAFGLITSIPQESGYAFDPLAEFNDATQQNQQMQFEKTMRGLFTAMDSFESLVRYSRYPNVTIHPIAVYRDFSSVHKSVVAG